MRAVPRTGQSLIDRALDVLRLALAPLADDVSLAAYAEVSATLGVTAVRIVHGLGRTPVGWGVIDRTASAAIWRTAWDAASITLQASGTVPARIRVW